MANAKKRVTENVAGDFFVDSTCIDCDTCRQIAPQVFADAGETSFVRAQPKTSEDRKLALQALVCCPTGSIGCLGDDNPKSVISDFPLLIEEPVYSCGFSSPKSFGGNSYFIQHPNGNWLIDSPKFLPHLVRRFETAGGIANIFLTHRDDVADADKYAQRFGSRRFIHRAELASQPDAEAVLDGWDAQEIAPDFLAIPTPGHTAGHMALLFEDRFLFTGDHLDFDRDEQRLAASHDYCWHSWEQQIESIEKLVSHDFEWVLPGHGQRVRLPRDEMKRQINTLVRRLRAFRSNGS